MHEPQRLGQRRHARARERFRREILRDEREQHIELRLDERANDLEGQPFGCRIHGEHAPLRHALGVRPEIHHLARLQLATVKESHGSGEQELVVLLDDAIEKGLSRPRHLDHRALVADHRLEDAQSFARRESHPSR